MALLLKSALPLLAAAILARSSDAQTWVYLTETPDYDWYAGCFGTASGNLAGFWDRHGLPDFYAGPTGGGLAPLDSSGGNVSIRSLWASRANVDGRPANKPGHMDDYYVAYEYSGPDPYLPAGRPEHSPDCIGDFIGLNQNKWTNLNNECRGNIDAFSFVFWDKTGNRRANFYTTNAGAYVPDIGSGLREWARYRGYDADVFTQLTSFNGERTTTNGFTYENVKAEINAGYPVLLFLQPTAEFSRTVGGVANVNPEIHGILIYGYAENIAELPAHQAVIVRTSWASGDNRLEEWTLHTWLGLFYSSPFAPRGVIGFHPKPKVRNFSRGQGTVTLTWDGPSSQLYDYLSGTSTDLHRYRVERATTLNPPNWKPVGAITSAHTATVEDIGNQMAFYRVVLVPNP
jgi:hypothetical protein